MSAGVQEPHNCLTKSDCIRGKTLESPMLIDHRCTPQTRPYIGFQAENYSTFVLANCRKPLPSTPKLRLPLFMQGLQALIHCHGRDIPPWRRPPDPHGLQECLFGSSGFCLEKQTMHWSLDPALHQCGDSLGPFGSEFPLSRACSA